MASGKNGTSGGVASTRLEIENTMELKVAQGINSSSAALTEQKQNNKLAVSTLREEGRSLLPISRVQKIIKADKELPIISKEAVFTISIATEEFIKRMTAASQCQAERENRTTVQKKDFATVAARAEEFFFMEDIFNWSREEKPQRVGARKAQ